VNDLHFAPLLDNGRCAFGARAKLPLALGQKWKFSTPRQGELSLQSTYDAVINGKKRFESCMQFTLGR
jgi:hypothetical protein